MSQGPSNWESVKALVADALELPATQREQFLIASCARDPALLEEARSLVAAYEAADGVIDRRTDAWLGLGGPDLLSLGGQRIGRYVLQRLIAEGAMAAVYIARQTSPQRSVALKLVRFNLPMVDAATRFKREAEALGRLQHPNIARIYEAGIHRPDDRAAMPFIAMEYIDGPPVTQYARQQNLTRDQRVELLIKVASAVQAAHQQAVIHRDLKPANVLVDANGEPKVLDFGIARILGTEDQNVTWQTTAGVLLGTPGYMSPEQAGGRAADVDVRSDVWSLGVLLYELLTGRLPIEVRDTSIVEVLKRIETGEPQPIGRLDRSLRGDLETVVMTALAREKEQRYPSAQALADDLQRVLDHQPISARAPTRWYRARKFARRHRLGIIISSAFLLLLASSAAVSSIAFVRARQERDKARAVNQFLQEMIASADPNVAGKDVTVLQALAASEQRIAASFGADPLTEAEVRSTLGWTYFNLSQYDRAHEQMARAVELRTSAGHAADPATIDDQSRLATILRWQYKPAEALEVARSAYALAAAELGAEHPSTIALLDPIAGAASDMADYDTAEREYLQAVAVNRRVMGDDNEQTLTAMNNLSVVYLERGKYAEAEPILRALVELRGRRLPAGSPPIITSRLNLAISIAEQGRIAEAEKELRQLAVDAGKSLGADHDSTITVKSNHAEMLQRLGRLDEALTIQKDAMDRRIAANGVAHDLSIKEIANYSGMLNQAERWEEAGAFARKALEAALSLHGPEHMTIAVCKQNLAAALQELGRHAEAEAMYREVIAFYEKQLGPDHPRTLIQRSNLGLALAAGGRSAEALALLEPALEAAVRKRLAYLEPSLRRNIGRALIAEKRYEQAEQQLLESHRLSESRQEARQMRKTAELLASLYQAWDRSVDAQRWRPVPAATRESAGMTP